MMTSFSTIKELFTPIGRILLITISQVGFFVDNLSVVRSVKTGVSLVKVKNIYNTHSIPYLYIKGKPIRNVCGGVIPYCRSRFEIGKGCSVLCTFKNIIPEILFKRKIMIRRLILLTVLALGLSWTAAAQNVALKTNLLYWATATPNLGLEASIARKHTVQLFYGLNPWKPSNGKSLKHWVLQPEYRYWFCESFNGWFLGVHLMGGEFNAGNVELPFGLFDKLKDHRYEGWYAGGGITAGYQWPLSRHWNIETSLGVGYDYIQYDKFKCGVCGERFKSSHSNYFGPTKLAVSVLYVF